MENVNLLSPSTLAFVGDAIYTLLVRTRLAEVNRPSGELHKLSVEYVKASAQAKAFELISPMLNEKEMSIFKRGRNAHTHSSPKNASGGDYHIATGIETLFGFLYLSGENERIEELFNLIWNNI